MPHPKEAPLSIPSEMTQDEIRQILRTYIRESDIGLPGLANRLKHEGEEIPLRMLHRFLDGESYVNARIVETCHQLAIRVKPTAAG